jgi:hypothetical protein
MNIDSVNNPKNKFNDNIYFALSNLTSFLIDPYIKYKPNKWSFLNKHRQAIKFLRDTGREQILKRIEMIKENQELPNDILTTILKSHGIDIHLLFLHVFLIFFLFYRGK